MPMPMEIIQMLSLVYSLEDGFHPDSDLLHQVCKDISKNLSALIQILNPHPLVIQMCIITGLATWEIGRWRRELLFQKPDCRDGAALADEDGGDGGGR